VGDLVRVVPRASSGGGDGGKGGKGISSSEQLLDTCSGTWLAELLWDKVGRGDTLANG
jgi:hypothetical protein